MHLIPQKVPVIYPSHLNKVTFCSHWYVRSRFSIRGGSAQRSNPLPFYIPFFPKKVPLSYTFY